MDLRLGDCRDVLREIEAESVDAIVTDPPYEIGFLGRSWDSTGVAFDPETWRVALATLRPGGYLLAFGSTRTSHRIAVAIEDAGATIQDTLAWLYGQGFPKGKGLLKPGFEPIVVARKGGSPGIRVEDSRLPTAADSDARRTRKSTTALGLMNDDGWEPTATETGGNDNGRWPANVALDEEAARMLDEQSGRLSSGHGPRRRNPSDSYEGGFAGTRTSEIEYDSGGASRFFYVSKASRGERRIGLGTDHPTVKPLRLMRWLVRLVSDPDDLVLDPFLGSGTTGAAALIEGRRFLGIEQDEATLDEARSRIGDLVSVYAPR